MDNHEILKGLVTYVGPQSNNAFKASREELQKHGVEYELFHISSRKSKNYLKKLKEDLTCLCSLMFKKYDFFLLNPGAALMQRLWLTRLLLVIARLKRLPVYVRWGSCISIFNKVKKRLGEKRYQKACNLISSNLVDQHFTLNRFSARDLALAVGVKESIIIYNCNKLPGKYLEPVLPEKEPIIINVGSVQYRKGPDLFVKIAGLVCANHPTARFVWIGGYAKQEIEEMIKEMKLGDRVAFIGKIKPPYEWMQKASMLLFTSRSDAFGLVCAEAMACHRTVVCFSGSGPEFIVGKTGVVVPQFDIKAAADEILKIVNRPAGQRINHAAHKRYMSMFSPEPYAERLADVLKNPEEAEKKYQYIATK